MGEVFGGRYELIDLIGEGGMGAVWRARDLKMNRLVAAKVLRQSDASALLRFVREQGLRVDHPNVIAPLGWIGEDNQVLFTMRIVAGGSLATLIGDHGALPPRFAAEILRQLLSGLQAVHSAHLVHRDVKPANILLDATAQERPHAYLTDFGIAIDLDGPRLTETGMVHGTPGYLAPELLSFGDATPAADLFAVGMVGASMITGARPRDIDIDGPVPEGVPESLWSLIRDLTASTPEARPDIPAALQRLDAPELAWQDGAAGEVEVFHQLEPLDPLEAPAAVYHFETPRAAGFHGSGLSPTPPASPPHRPSPGTGFQQPTPPTRQSQPAYAPVPGQPQRAVGLLSAPPPVAMPQHGIPVPAKDRRRRSDWVLFTTSLLLLIGGVVLLVLWYIR
jgi:putative non-specific serine/threonine protein kinase